MPLNIVSIADLFAHLRLRLTNDKFISLLFYFNVAFCLIFGVGFHVCDNQSYLLLNINVLRDI